MGVMMRHGEKPPGGSSDQAATRAERLEAVFRDRYRAFQYAYVQFLTEHLVDCSRQFGGDLQKMLILAVIGQATLHWVRRVDAPDPIVAQADSGAVSASRLSDLTGIPRQTIRRKLAALAASGWIEQTENGSWRIRFVEGEARARTDLSALDHRSIARVARLVSALTDLER